MGSLSLADCSDLRMATSYLRRGMRGTATFSLCVRRLPPDRGFLVACGLEDCLAFLEGWGSGRSDRAFLKTVEGLRPADVRALAAMRFTGDVWAVPEGSVVFESEPLLEVTAPIAVAQVVTTFLLNQITFQTAIATRAARCRVAARGRRLINAGFPVGPSLDAAIAATRASAIAGFSATSNAAAADRLGLSLSGSVTHSYIEAFDDESEALRSFAEDFPDRPAFLVDTFDTAVGVQRAIAVARALGLGDAFAIRLGSPDVETLAHTARELLDDAGCRGAPILASGRLDEYGIEALVSAGAPVDAFAVGPGSGASEDAAALECVFDLVAYDGRPVLELSAGTGTLPGAKQIFRNLRRGYEILGLREEDIPGFTRVLRPVMLAGRRTTDPESVETMRTRLDADLELLPEGAARIRGPEPLTVRVSPNLERLRRACVDRVSSPSSSPPPPPGIRTADDPRIVACTTEVTVSDGSRIRIRPVVIADQDGIVRGFEQLSAESRVRRFFIPPTRLSESMLRYLTEIDYTNHVALGAFAIDDPGEPGVAIARYVRLNDDPTCAEAAVTVIDSCQRRGIATVLLEALALIALRNGISRFCGYVQWENTEILDLARRVGATVQPSSQAVARIELPLADVDEHIGETGIRSALRILACLEVTLAADGIHVTASEPPTAALAEVATTGAGRISPHPAVDSALTAPRIDSEDGSERVHR